MRLVWGRGEDRSPFRAFKMNSVDYSSLKKEPDKGRQQTIHYRPMVLDQLHKLYTFLVKRPVCSQQKASGI